MGQNQKKEQAKTPRIYIASLSDYNAGKLIGRWIDADQSVDDIRREIAEMLTESKEPLAEEWAIHDYENFGSLKMSEVQDLSYVADIARLMGEYGTLFAELVAYCSDVREAVRYMEEGYWGEFDRLEEYAAHLVEDCYGREIDKLPMFIKNHLDYEGMAHDMEVSGDVFTIAYGGKVHVFNSHI